MGYSCSLTNKGKGRMSKGKKGFERGKKRVVWVYCYMPDTQGDGWMPEGCFK